MALGVRRKRLMFVYIETELKFINFKLSYTQADSLDPFKSKTQNNQGTDILLVVMLETTETTGVKQD